jgi:hypothetical protein
MTVNIKKKSGSKVHSATLGPTQSGVASEIQVAVGAVLTKSKDGAEEKSSEEVAVVHGPGPFANVGVRAKRTINLGNFENVQFEVSLFCPAVHDVDEIDQTFAYVSGWVDGKMQELSAKYEDSPSAGEVSKS